ncbi:MAG: hypothetical protein NTW03_07795, partial [Verrucomicrobia bacterium]|nr:hypothetical protein [Verrucomicrobiota bacterium]
RIWVTPPELYVSRVTMKRGTKEAAPGQRPVAEADFSKADEVHIALGEGEQEHAAGLRHLDYVRDGLTVQTNLNNVPCRHLKVPGGGIGYLYFNIAPTFKNRNLGDLTMEVEYFDDKPGTLAVEFDATPSPEVRKLAYVNAGQTVRLRASHSWRVATFQIRNATFRNSQNSGADFRVCVFPPDLYVRRVSLTRGLKPADRPHRG